MKGIIVDTTHDSYGVIKGDGKVIFVDGGLPGDTVEYKITKEKKNYCYAELVEIIDYSKLRILNENPLGSSYPLYPMDYWEALEGKINSFKYELKKVFDIHPEIKVIPSRKRKINKIRLHVDGKNWGLYKRKTNEIEKIDISLIMENIDNAYIDEVVNNLENASYLIVRTDSLNRKYLATDGIIKKDLADGIKDINGARGETPAYILNEKVFHVDIDGFFQTNTEIAQKVLQDLPEINTKFLDLYGGVGFLSIGVNSEEEFTIVEINESATKRAKENLILNQKNAQIICKDTKEYIVKQKEIEETIILDPPRTGLDKEVVEKILELAPQKIIYMSCNHTTLIRDLKEFSKKYTLQTINVYDMFVYTTHLECVVLLETI